MFFESKVIGGKVKIREKITAVLLLFLILLTMGGFNAYHGGPRTGIESSKDLKGRSLGGVESKMPANSSKIFFESLTGVKLGAYKSYNTLDEAVCALYTGKVSAIWATDVTADYLMQIHPELRKLDTEGMSTLENTDADRFSFGMACRNDAKGRELAESLSTVIRQLRGAGVLDELADTYIKGAVGAEKFSASDAISSGITYRKMLNNPEVLRIGITGAAAPVELIDEEGVPYGYCVALCDDLAIVLEKRLELVVLDNETAFSRLMSGAVDALFCYGSGNITTEGTKAWVMTEGYYPCHKYEFLVMGGSEQ